MPEKNMFSKIENFAGITTNRQAMKVFLIIAKNRVRNIHQLVEDSNLSLKDVVNSVDKLENGDFIAKNPDPTSQKFKLGFNGQLFAEQLKSTYPEVRSYLGENSLIEPLNMRTP